MFALVPPFLLAKSTAKEEIAHLGFLQRENKANYYVYLLKI